MTRILDTHGENEMIALREKYDLFICTAGFEDRTLSGLEKVCNNTSFTRSVINLYKIEEPELMSRNLLHLERMSDILKKICPDVEVVNNIPNDPMMLFHNLDEHLKGVDSVLIDITSFTRLFLYSLLTICLQNNVKTHILYSEPSAYTMNFAQGLEDIIILPTNPGIPDQSKKVLLVMFLGWESKRLASVVEEWNPDKIIAISESSTDEYRSYWNKVTLEQCSGLLDKAESYAIPALTPESTVDILEQIYVKHREIYDICILNIGPKIQCLGITEFAFRHEEIQVLYPKPYKWKQEIPSSDHTNAISTGQGRTYVFEYPTNILVEHKTNTL